MADIIAIVMMAVAFVLLLVSFIRLFPDLRAEARADAAQIRLADARARAAEVARTAATGNDSQH